MPSNPSNQGLWTVLGALAAVGAAVVAAIYTWLTYRLVRGQSEPNVVLYVRHDETRPSILQIVVENIGHGLASDVRFAPSRPIPHRTFGLSAETAEAPESSRMPYGPLAVGIPTLGPGDSRIIDWGQFGGLRTVLGDKPIDVIVRYRHGTKEMTPVVAHLEVASFEGTVAHTTQLGEAVTALEKIAAAAEKISRG